MSAEEADRLFLKGLTLLYAEDDPDTRRQLASFLGRRVARLHVARDGAEALRMFEADRPDLVVTDILMPELDGLGLVEQIRRRGRGVPVVVTTAFDLVDYLLRAIELGVERYVVKPVVAERLDAALLSCAHLLRAERELERQRGFEAEARRFEAVRRLAGGMAHDYNNMLQAVLSNVSLALDDVAPGSFGRECLLEAERCGREAARLGKLLVDLGSSASGPGSRTRVALGAAVATAVAAARPGAAVRWQRELEPEQVVAADAAQLSLLFRELAENALEAMPAGGTLTTRLSARDVASADALPVAAGRYAEVELADTGCGIPAAELEQVFDPYYTSKERGTERGVGLGLALCRAVVARHAGTITVASTPGVGSTFRVLLPLSEPAA